MTSKWNGKWPMLYDLTKSEDRDLLFSEASEVLYAQHDNSALQQLISKLLVAQTGSDKERAVNLCFVGIIEFPRQGTEITTTESRSHIDRWKKQTAEWLRKAHGAALRKIVYVNRNGRPLSILFLILGSLEGEEEQIPLEYVHPGDKAKRTAKEAGMADKAAKEARRNALIAYKEDYAIAVANLKIEHIAQSLKNRPFLEKVERNERLSALFRRSHQSGEFLSEDGKSTDSLSDCEPGP